MKNTILFLSLIAFYPTLSQAKGLRCVHTFSSSLTHPLLTLQKSQTDKQSSVSKSVNTSGLNPKVGLLVEKLGENNFKEAGKILKNIVFRISQTNTGKVTEASRSLKLSEADKSALLKALESSYKDLPLGLMSKAMSLYVRGKFNIDMQNLEGWGNAYAHKLHQVEGTNLQASNFSRPLHGINLLRKPIPENVLQAVHALILRQGQSLKYQTEDVFFILKAFATAGRFRVDPLFKQIMDNKATEVLKQEVEHSIQGTSVNSSQIIKIFLSFRALRRMPSEALQGEWLRIEDHIIEFVRQKGEQRLDQELDRVLSFLNRGKEGTYDQATDIEFFDGLNN